MAPLVLRIGVNDEGNPAIMGMEQNVKRLKKQVAPVGKMMAAIFTSAALMRGIAAVSNGIRSQVKNVYEYELALKRIEAITGTTGDALAGMGKQARDLAIVTEFSATEIAKAQLEMTKGGFEVNEVFASTPAILDLATASTSELAWAAKNSINALRAFNMDAGQMERVANVMATALNRSTLNMEDYMQALKFVAPISKATNTSFEETSALLGALADIGLKGSIGGTTLKNILLNILKPSDRVAAALRTMNLDGKSVTAVLEGLRDRGMNVVDFLETFNKRAVAGAVGLAELRGKVEKFTDALNHQARTAKEMAEVMRSSTILTWQQMLNVIGEIGLSIGDALGGGPQSILASFIVKLKSMDMWVDNNQERIQGWIKKITSLVRVLSVGLMPTITNIGKTLAAMWAVEKVSNYISMIKRISMASKMAATGVVALQGTIILLTAAFIAADIALSNWIKNLDQQAKNVSDNYGTQAHLDQLIKIRTAYGEVAKAQDKVDKARGIVAPGLAKEDLKASQKELNLLLKQYGKSMGKNARIRIEDNKELDNTIRNLQIINKISREIKETPKAPKKEDPNSDFGAFLSGLDAGADKSKGAESLKDTTKILEDLNWQLWQGGYNVTLMSGNFEKLFALNTQLSDFTTRLEPLSAADAAAKSDALLATYKKLTDFSEGMNQYFANENAQRNQEYINGLSSLADSAMSIWETINNSQLETTLSRLDKEEAAIKKRYDSELLAAGESAFRKTIAEEKFQQKEEEIQKKREAAEAEARSEEKTYMIVKATADAAMAAVGAFAGTSGGFATRLGAGLAAAAIAGSYVASLTSILSNYRHGGVVEGRGNESSDSVPAWLSRNERVLTTNDISSLGGNSKIDQMIDRGTSYSTSDNRVVHIDTFIGTREFARQMIPEIQKELAR